MKKDLRYLPVFMALSLIYFRDVFLKGTFLAVGDGLSLFYPGLIEVSRQYKSFTLPLWNPDIFSGFPLMASTQHSALYPPSVIPALILSAPLAYNFNLMIHYTMAGFFAFLYLRRIGLEAWPSLGGGMVYSLLGYLAFHLPYPPILYACTWAPLIMYFYEGLRQKPNFRDMALGSLAVAMQALGGHPQICAYTYFLLILFTAFHLLHMRGEKLRFIAFCAGTAVIGLMIASPQIVAAYELSGLSERAAVTYRYFSTFSFPFKMLPGFIFPFLYGGGYGGPPWLPMSSKNISEMWGFVGILPFLTGILAVIKRFGKDIHVRFWGLVAAVSLVLSFGDNFPLINKLLYRLPLLSYFRMPAKHLFEADLALSVLSAVGFSLLLRGDSSYRKALLVLLVLITAVSPLIFGFFGDSLKGLIIAGESAHRIDPAKYRDAFKVLSPAIYVPLVFSIFYLISVYILPRAKTLAKYMIFSGIFLEALLYRVNTPYDRHFPDNYEKGVFSYLSGVAGSDRVAFITTKIKNSQFSIQYGFQTVDGWDPLILNEYSELLNMRVSGYSEEWDAFIRDNLLLSMLNARYIVVDGSQNFIDDIRALKTASGFSPPIGLGLPQSEDFEPPYRKLLSIGGISIYENLNALPRVFSVERLIPVSSIHELRLLFYGFRIEPGKEAALEPDDLKSIGGEIFSSGKTVISGYKPDEVTLRATFPARGFIVLSEQYYPGWKAFIDGAQTRLYRTNGVLRGIVVPEGEHEIVFKYFPGRIYLSLVVSAVFLGLLIYMLLKARRGKTF